MFKKLHMTQKDEQDFLEQIKKLQDNKTQSKLQKILTNVANQINTSKTRESKRLGR